LHLTFDVFSGPLGEISLAGQIVQVVFLFLVGEDLVDCLLPEFELDQNHDAVFNLLDLKERVLSCFRVFKLIANFSDRGEWSWRFFLRYIRIHTCPFSIHRETSHKYGVVDLVVDFQLSLQIRAEVVTFFRFLRGEKAKTRGQRAVDVVVGLLFLEFDFLSVMHH
jgi:hypothetical protein